LDYAAASREYSRRCRVCGGAFIRDARHVTEDGRIETCIPEDNLRYLEREYLRRSKDKKELQ
jgi:hypothetical protein